MPDEIYVAFSPLSYLGFISEFIEGVISFFGDAAGFIRDEA